MSQENAQRDHKKHDAIAFGRLKGEHTYLVREFLDMGEGSAGDLHKDFGGKDDG